MALIPGTKLDRYEITGAIAAGGMGAVYRARDPRLERDVAVKVMAAELAKDGEWLHRFEQEARAAAALSHANILAVYDVGQSGGVSFIVTELLEGETLRERLRQGALPVAKALEVTVQILSGLDAAHARGIVHRDMKPENIFMTRQDQVKILDFGLAKVTAVDSVGADAEATAVSQSGTIVGTYGYMSPEQARGWSTDCRSDIFAVGAILYEMLCGQRAFHGASTADTISAVLKEEPPSLAGLGIAAAPALLRLVSRCIEKDAAKRFQSARETALALESVSRAKDLPNVREKTGEKSVAVLPFTNVGSDAEQEYFSDGLADELINALAGLSGLRVVSRTSAFRFRARDLDIREIGKQLNVETVLEGSVRRAGKRLRITAQLINAADGYTVWSQRYDRELEDVFAIQDEITESIVRMLKPTLLGEQQAATRRHTENVEAFQLYLKGRHLWQQRTRSALQVSIEYFEKAVALDPNYALAHAGIADSLSILRVYGYVSDESWIRAETASKRALELDPGLAEAHFASALFLLYFGEDWRAAETRLREALRISPQNGLFHTYLGFFLATCHRSAEAQTSLSTGIERDPLSPLGYSLYALSMYIARRYEEAIQLGERALELYPDFSSALVAIGSAHAALGRYEQAIAALERATTVASPNAWLTGHLAFAYARSGRTEDALRIRAEFAERRQHEYVTPYAELLADFGLQDRERIYEDLQKCITARITGFMIEILVGPYVDELDGEPRFHELFSRLRLGGRKTDGATSRH